MGRLPIRARITVVGIDLLCGRDIPDCYERVPKSLKFARIGGTALWFAIIRNQVLHMVLLVD